MQPKTRTPAWGYSLGAVYIRKLYFRDTGKLKQIKEEVANLLMVMVAATQAPNGVGPK